MLRKNMNHISVISRILTMILSSVIVILVAISCDSNKSPTSPPANIFSPTDHIIGSSGKTLSLTVKHYDSYYSLSADTSKIDQTNKNSFFVDNNEMNSIAKSLSDTSYFNWEFMTAVAPYPQEDCVLLVVLGDFLGYMCTLGSGKTASNTLQNLIEPLSGEARNVLDNLVITLKNEDGT